MAVNVLNSVVGTPPIDAGVYFRAPLGTKLPTTASEALDPAFVDHGAVGEDGFTVTESRDTTDIKMMGGGTFRTVQTSYTAEIKIVLLEALNEAVAKTTLGDKAVKSTDAGLTLYHTENPLPISTHVLKVRDGDRNGILIVEKGQITSIGDKQYSAGDVARTEVTIKAYKSDHAGYDGAYVVEIWDKPKSVPVAPESGTVVGG